MVCTGGIYIDIPPNIPPVILGMVNGYVAMDIVVPSVENILCNKLNIQPFLVKYSGIYCTLGSEYFSRPLASGNIPTLGALYTDIPRGRVEYLYMYMYNFFYGMFMRAFTNYLDTSRDEQHNSCERGVANAAVSSIAHTLLERSQTE